MQGPGQADLPGSQPFRLHVGKFRNGRNVPARGAGQASPAAPS
jgi:hypothetical protein